MKNLLILMFLFSCAQVEKRSAVEQYRANAAQLIALAKSGQSEGKIATLANLLISNASPIMNQFKSKNPNCGELIDSTLRQADYMKSISLEEIEDKFHAGSALPKAPESCYDIKELVVHPATVTILTKAKLNAESREQIVDEIDEVIAHLDDLKL